MINLHNVLDNTDPLNTQLQGLSRTKLTSLNFRQPEPESFLGNIGEYLNYDGDDDAGSSAEVRVNSLSDASAVDDDIARPFQSFAPASASEGHALHLFAERPVSLADLNLPLS